jgi:hypothetical protein
MILRALRAALELATLTAFLASLLFWLVILTPT